MSKTIQYDFAAAVALSHRIYPDGSLSSETLTRTKSCIDYYRHALTDMLIMSGGYADSEAPCTHAEAMRSYAIQHGVPRHAVCMEKESLDTVGQAIFLKTRIVVPQNWEKLIVVSSDYHMKRVEQIFDFVFGDEFELQYYGTYSGHYMDAATQRKELQSLATFFRTFQGVQRGSDSELLQRLYEKHPLYQKESSA